MKRTWRLVWEHPSVLLPLWVYRTEFVRIGLRTDHVAHIFFNRWRIIR